MQEPTALSTSDSATQLYSSSSTNSLRGIAVFLGERLNLRLFNNTESLASDPLLVRAGAHGYAVLFPYGVAVLFGLEPVEEVAFLTQLEPLIEEEFEFKSKETEEVELRFDQTGTGRIENGRIWLQSFTIEILQLVADVLAKSVVLAHYENGTARIFEQIEPFADGLQRRPKSEQWGKVLLKQLGQNLSIQHKIVGRVEIIDKPELLWDSPSLERVYLRLEDEYEIRERHLALERKLELISRTAETVLEMLQHNSSLRVEWYIVALIVIEILLSLYDLFIA
ncbi:MAG: RMD1 family protein [Synechococcales bacterium]|nr:RMD1 family protein [Synechococcales bacterium]